MQAKSLRLTERWFQRALWILAVIFAWFLIGMGGLIVGDLPKVTAQLGREQFMQQPQTQQLRDRIDAEQQVLRAARESRAQARLVAKARNDDLAAARSSFQAWVATRRATGLAAQDSELVARTRNLETLQAAALAAQQKVQAGDTGVLDSQQAIDDAQRQLDVYARDAQQRYDRARRAQELRVFGVRLAFTLPLLLLAGWLMARHRRTRYWPFVWGFAFFALFAFFVELVPYLPSYGGYVRYAVGIVLTLVIGTWGIRRFQAYLEQQKSTETRPEAERRKDLGYDLAQARLAKNVCPGCERPVDLKDTARNFCMHCGIALFDTCPACGARKSAFGHFCHACGHGATPDTRADMPASSGQV